MTYVLCGQMSYCAGFCFWSPGTPADKMLAILNELLDGTVPSVQDVLFVQAAILESADLYQPLNLGKQLTHGLNANMDVSGCACRRNAVTVALMSWAPAAVTLILIPGDAMSPRSTV
jgi:hypothetical protein